MSVIVLFRNNTSRSLANPRPRVISNGTREKEHPGNEKEVKGKWNASDENNAGSWTITNSWVSANYRFDGSTDFYIKKIDKDGNPLAGVEFEINGETTPTNESGMIEISIPEELTIRDGIKNYEIQEVKTQEGYDLDSGVANLEVEIESAFAGFDNNSFTNIFSKKFTFTASGNENYIWNPTTRTFVLKNNRSTAKSLTIEKSFSGVTASALINNDLSFTVSGPDDFETMTIKIADFEIDEEKGIATYVLENVPTGLYTVSENNAEIEYFELNASGDYGEEKAKTVSKDEQVEFKITNEYEVEKTTYRVVKIWRDEHDKDGIRPTKLAVNFLANGEVVETKELSSDDETQDEWGEDLESSDVWEYTFEDLPVADENAELIEYYAEEVLETDKYEQIDEISGRHTVIFVNMHEPEDDPCANGGCGSMNIPEAPNTGKLTNLTKNEVDSSINVNVMVAAITIMFGLTLAGIGASIKRK